MKGKTSGLVSFVSLRLLWEISDFSEEAMGKTQAFQKRFILVRILAGSAPVSIPSIQTIFFDFSPHHRARKTSE